MKKTISVVVPCYNDSGSVYLMYERVNEVFSKHLPNYNYELIYADDCSPDGGKTWSEIKRTCELDPEHVRGVLNITNFGAVRNWFSALKLGTGDATFILASDLQDPPELLPTLVEHWKNGANAVAVARTNSYSTPIIKFARSLYYKLMAKVSAKKIPNGISGYGLYDKKFIDIMKNVNDIQALIPSLLAEYAPNAVIINSQQEKSSREKSGFNFWSKYDYAMLSITGTSKFFLRMMTFVGSIVSLLSFLFTIVAIIFKLLYWNNYSIGIASIITGIFFIGGIQLFFMGIIGEYILSINNRSMIRPHVVIGETCNYERIDVI